MHTFTTEKVIVNYNTDLSGDVRIVNRETKQEVWVDGNSIKDFIAGWVIKQKISQLEAMDYDEVLGIKEKP